MSDATIHLSREHRIYLALWRKALTATEEIAIKCSSKQMAIAMRLGMYRAIKPFRHGILNDEELKQAAEKYVLAIEPVQPPMQIHHLVIKRRETLMVLEGILDQFDIDEEDLLSGDERQTKKRLANLARGGTPAAVKRSNKFFERE